MNSYPQQPWMHLHRARAPARPPALALAGLLLLAALPGSLAAAGAGDVTAATPTSVTVGVSSTITLSTGSTDSLYWCMQSGASCGSTCTNGGGSDVMTADWTAVTMAGSVAITWQTGASASTGSGNVVLCLADDGSGGGSVKQTFGTFSIVAATPNNLYTAISPTTATQSQATSFTLTNGGSGGTNEKVQLLSGSCAYSSTATTLTSLIFSATLSTATTYKLCVTALGGTDSIQQGTVTVTVSSASVVGDPVAYVGSKAHHFWLPIGILMPLLRTPDLDVYGSTYQGLTGKMGQYFDRYIVASKGGLTVEVSLRDSDTLATLPPNLPLDPPVSMALEPTETPDPPVSMALEPTETLDSPVSMALEPTQNLNDFKTLRLNYLEGASRATTGLDDGWTQVQGLHGLVASKLPAEAIEVYSNSIHFTICSVYDESFRSEKWLLPEFSHLAFQLVRSPEAENYTGIFPELWGMKPMSNCTAALMDMDGEPQPLAHECLDWVGYGETSSKQLAAPKKHLMLPHLDL